MNKTIEHISFLRKCQRLNVIPKFIKVKSAVDNNRSKLAIKKAEKEWCKNEIKHLFKKLAEKELTLYNLHLKITRDMSDSEHRRWLNVQQHVLHGIEHTLKKVRKTHNDKIQQLTVNKHTENLTPEFLPNFIVNESSENFSGDELNLLNRGLKFTPAPMKLNIFESVVDIETLLKYKVPSIQNDIRSIAADIISDAKTQTHLQQSASQHASVVDSLKQKKDIVYIKADKSNQIVIGYNLIYHRNGHPSACRHK